MPWGPSVHVLRIELRHVEPPIWRTFAVASDTKLPKFNRILQAVMGWEGYHLHAFDVAGIMFGEKDEDADYVIGERNVTVQQILPRPDSALRWDYDLGDGWEHDVVVQAIEEPSPEVRYPICTGGERACPPEDCGGLGGYEELAAWVRGGYDPRATPMGLGAQEMRDWLPRGWHPDRFSVTETNDALAASNMR